MGQTQTADGTGRVSGNSLLQDQFRTFNAGADVQRMRLDAYGDEYAEVAFKGTQKALCLPCGGELHLPGGEAVPVAPYDWVIELPNGTMGSLTAEEIADHMEFISGSDAQREAFTRTQEYVANARKPPADNVDVRVDDAPVMPHPDGFENVEAHLDHAESERLLAEFQARTEEARAQLEVLANIAVERGTIDRAEADSWVDTGVAPEGVSVRFDVGLRSYEITRAPAPVQATQTGATASMDGSPDGAGAAAAIDLAAIDPLRVKEPSGQ